MPLVFKGAFFFMKKLLAVAVVAALTSSQVAAQHVTVQGSGLQRSEAVIGVGLTIPFGGSEKQKQPARIDLQWTRDTMQADGSRLSVQTGRAFRGSLGIALDRDLDNRLMINGRPLPKQEQRSGVSTAGWVGIAVVGGAALIFGGLVLAQQLQGPTD